MMRALILLLLLAAPARKAEPPPTAELLRQEVGAWELARQLQLTDAQKAALRPIVQDELARRAALAAQREADEPTLTRLLQAHLTELRAGRDGDATRAALREHAAAQRPDDRQEHRQAVRAQLESLLSPEQQDALRRFRPLAPSEDERREALAERIGVDADDLARIEAYRQARRAERGEAVRNADGEPKERHGGALRGLKVLFSEPMLEVLGG